MEARYLPTTAPVPIYNIMLPALPQSQGLENDPVFRSSQYLYVAIEAARPRILCSSIYSLRSEVVTIRSVQIHVYERLRNTPQLIH